MSLRAATPTAATSTRGLDRFGRVVEQRWVNASAVVTDDFLYGYNADSDVLTRNNALNSSFNEQYSYGNLNRLTSFTGPGNTQSWSLDAVGNWSSLVIVLPDEPLTEFIGNSR
jgi:hypothetical protein